MSALNFIRQAPLGTRGALALWGTGLLFWPLPANLPGDPAARLTASYGEGLYKSDLTEANSGLLGARFFESFEGKKSWDIHSQFAELHRNEKKFADLRKVDADFYSSNSGNVVHTKSDFGQSYFDKRFVTLEGNVVVNSHMGYRFSMDTLDYDGNSRRFFSDDVVQMRGPNPEKPEMFLTGRGLDAGLNEGNFLVRKQSRARRRLSNNTWIHIQSVESEFFPSTHRAVFKKSVTAQLPNLTIKSDGLEMHMGDSAGELLIAKGNVTLFHKDRKGESDRADIELANDTIILEGNASITSEDSEMSGRKITLHTDDDRIEVENATGSSRQ
ncbi:LPS export ABC transporter periplasmic protein LptC [bacterium]|nr:LPS export ABC transporter periplasmic protein LptC [bacterium]